jgi:hypothetical protein
MSYLPRLTIDDARFVLGILVKEQSALAERITAMKAERRSLKTTDARYKSLSSSISKLRGKMYCLDAAMAMLAEAHNDEVRRFHESDKVKVKTDGPDIEKDAA